MPTARSIIVLFFVIFGLAACGSEDTVIGSNSEPLAASADTSSKHGLDLMLPFPAASRLVLTRSYDNATHKRHANAPEWDDTYAVDFAGEGCGGGWGSPILAAAAGTVVAYPLPGSLATRVSLVKSYGDSQVFVDHGNGCFTHYGHLDSNAVRTGQRVQQGEQIGRMGAKGHVESSCPNLGDGRWGAHLHFKVVCNGIGVAPEPLSGYRDLDQKTGRLLNHQSLAHPAGTLVKSASGSDIFLVSRPGELRHVRNEQVWRSYRFFQDASREWETVVTVSDDELACHDRGLALDTPASIEATTCLNGGAWPTYVTFDDGRTRWRRRVPFTPNEPGYAIVLRSWGFRTTDVIVNGRSCGIATTAGDERLPLRDGTVIEQASDNDFYVVSDGGIAYRLYRNLMPVLYGAGWPQVIQVPDGSVPSLVLRMSSADREFTVTDATTCHNGSRTLRPGNGDGRGGGETDGPGIGENAPSPAPAPAPSPQPSTCPADACVVGSRKCHDEYTPIDCVANALNGCGYWVVDDVCQRGSQCGGVSAMCQTASQPPAPAPVPAPAPDPEPPQTADDPPHTLRCTASDSALTVALTGPVLDALVARPQQPRAFQVGSDQNGWVLADLAAWAGERAYALRLPASADGFNLYLADASDARRDSWLDLVDANGDGVRWSVVGDCRLDGTRIIRGSGSVSAPAPVPSPRPAPAPAPVPDPPHADDGPALACTASGDGLTVAVDGLSPQALVDGQSVSALGTVGASGDGTLGWTPSAEAARTDCDEADRHCDLTLPVGTSRFNLWVWSGGRAYWFDLSRWSASGACRIADDGLGGLVLIRR